MRGKTALAKAHRNEAQRANAAGVGGRGARLGRAALMGLAVAGMMVCGGQVYSLFMQERSVNSLQEVTSQAQQRVTSALAPLRRGMANVAEDPEIVDLAARDSVVAAATIEARIRLGLPDAMEVLVLSENLDSSVTEAHPALSYASLDMLMEARSTARPAPAQLHAAGTEREALSLVYPVVRENQVLCLLLASFPSSLLRDAIGKLDVSDGYAAVTQGQGRADDYVIEFSGRSALRNDLQAASNAIPDSHFLATYTANQPFLLFPSRNMTLFGTLFGLSGLLLLAALGLPLRKKKETPSEEDSEVLSTEEIRAAVEDRKLERSMAFADTLEEGADAAAEEPEAPQASDVQLDRSIFRAYDIRGIVGETLSPDTAYLIGQAIGSEGIDRGVEQIAVARDGRLSGPELTGGLIEGLRSTGLNVIDLGAVPTPVLYFATHHLEIGSGVMVTGSHNPPQYNGFKVMLAEDTLSGDDITSLFERIEQGNFHAGDGGVQDFEDIIEEYIERVASDVQVEEPLKVVVDCGNGIAGIVAPRLLEEIGCEVVPLFCDVDGEFPNHHPDPSDLENLRDLIASVKQFDADIGVAFDGDGDRLGVVTAEGEIIFADRLLMLFAQDVLLRNPGAAVIYDVKSTGRLSDVVLSNGGSPVMWKTGHSFIKNKMKEIGAALAGEMSGHFFFQERWYGFDDGVYSAARMLEILAAEPESPSVVLGALPTGVSTPEIKVEMEEGAHYAFMDRFQDFADFEGARITEIDGVRADFDDGWGLVRCSNTTPCLVIRFEADDEPALKRIKAQFRAQILAQDKDLELPF